MRTYDDKITLSELNQLIRSGKFFQQPLDLLVLSACDTAEGDERANLGFAGLSIRAGASSVIASLWSVNDQSTAKLIPKFFENLQNKALSKAHALRLAKLELLKTQQYRDPYYWASFVLVGNWY